MEEKKKFIRITKDLDDQQFRFLILAIFNQSPQTIQKTLPDLFAPFITDENNCEIIAHEVVSNMGEYDKTERAVYSFNLSVADTRNIRKWLGLRDLDELAAEKK